MSQKWKIVFTLIISILLVTSLSGCTDDNGDTDDENDDTPPPYIPHYKNNNVSLEIIQSYSTDHLEGENEDGNFTIESPSLTKQYHVVLLKITNTMLNTDQTAQMQVYTDETLMEILNNREEDRSVIDGRFIEDPDSGDQYEVKNFNFTDMEGYPSTYGGRYMDNGDHIVQAVVGYGPPGSMRRVIVGFKIMMGTQLKTFQKVSIEV